MPQTVDTTEARRLHADGVPFVDVLPPAAFAEEHIDGAVNVPLTEIDKAPVLLERDEPVVVYCFDHQ